MPLLVQQALWRQFNQQSFVFLFEKDKGKADRNTHISGWSLSVCPAGWTACLHMICRGPLCVLKEWNVSVSVMSGQDIFKVYSQASAQARMSVKIFFLTKRKKKLSQWLQIIPLLAEKWKLWLRHSATTEGPADEHMKNNTQCNELPWKKMNWCFSEKWHNYLCLLV